MISLSSAEIIQSVVNVKKHMIHLLNIETEEKMWDFSFICQTWIIYRIDFIKRMEVMLFRTAIKVGGNEEGYARFTGVIIN